MTNRGLLWLFDEYVSFKKIPPSSDRETFGKMLLSCANGDGKITPAEREWVLGFLDAFGATDAEIKALTDYQGNDDVAKLVESSPLMKKSANVALYDALRACHADGELAAGEIAALEKAAVAMGIEAAKVRALIELYDEEQKLKQKRLRLTFPAGLPFQ